MITVRNLSCFYHGVPVVEGASFHVGRGEIVGLVGRNGIGKSTILRSILGFAPYEGELLCDGDTITGPPERRVRRYGISFLPQEDRVSGGLSIRESLLLAASTRESGFRQMLRSRMFGQPRSGEADPLIEELEELIDSVAFVSGRYGDQVSGGEATVVGLLCCVFAGRRYLLLDEPSASASEGAAEKIARAIKALAWRRGYGILLVEQDHNFLCSVASRLLLVLPGEEMNGARLVEADRRILSEKSGLRLEGRSRDDGASLLLDLEHGYGESG